MDKQKHIPLRACTSAFFIASGYKIFMREIQIYRGKYVEYLV